MTVTRREFLAISGVVGAGLALSSLGLDMGPVKAYAAELKDRQDESRQAEHHDLSVLCRRMRDYLQYGHQSPRKSSTPKAIRITPSTKGLLCAKGAALFQTTANNPNRLQKVLYRAPGSDKWEEKSWDWALTEIAKRVKATRDAYFIEKNGKGQVVNRARCHSSRGKRRPGQRGIAGCLQAMMRALGLVYIEHQARI